MSETQATHKEGNMTQQTPENQANWTVANATKDATDPTLYRRVQVDGTVMFTPIEATPTARAIEMEHNFDYLVMRHGAESARLMIELLYAPQGK